MASVTLKDIPARLHRELRQRAERNRRSLSQEALACLEQAVRVQPVDVEALLRQARAARKNVKPVKQSDIDKWIREGRP